MELNYLGVVAALAAFLSIWWGHVGVRKIEATSVRTLAVYSWNNLVRNNF